MKHIFFAAIYVYISAVTTYAQDTASFSGRVTNESGEPMASISILYNRIRTLTRDAAGNLQSVPPFVNSASQSKADGSFAVAGVPEGDYYICAEAAV